MQTTNTRPLLAVPPPGHHYPCHYPWVLRMISLELQQLLQEVTNLDTGAVSGVAEGGTTPAYIRTDISSINTIFRIFPRRLPVVPNVDVVFNYSPRMGLRRHGSIGADECGSGSDSEARGPQLPRGKV